jgi:hypothetical protein
MTRIHWKRLQSEGAVRDVLLRDLPVTSPVTSIQFFATEQGLECSEPVDDKIICSAPAPGRRPWVSAKWLIEFHLTDDRLANVTVRRGFTGP